MDENIGILIYRYNDIVVPISHLWSNFDGSFPRPPFTSHRETHNIDLQFI